MGSPTALGWKTKASHPSKPCRMTSVVRQSVCRKRPGSALHTIGVLQVYQPRSSGIQRAVGATDLALRADKATAQAIGRTMASLVMLERHLQLNLTDIKTAFLDSPIFPSGLISPAVDGFTECFTAAQKT